MFAALLAALTAATPDAAARPFPVKLPAREDSPIFQNGLPRTGAATPAPKKRFFGLGIGFMTRGGATGIVLEQVVPASPADRAGLTALTVIAEINGESTLGRSGEDCTRMVREGGNAVTLKFYDPATLKLRTRVLEKDWFPLPGERP